MHRHSARFVANYLLQLAEASGKTLTPMQVIKLVYLCHGWLLGLLGLPLIRENVEAWRYGPVIPDLYKAVRQYRSDPVQGPLRDAGNDAVFDEAERDIVAQVFQVYGDDSGIALSRLTHAPGTPWHITWNSEGQNSIISNDLIQEHFASLANDG